MKISCDMAGDLLPLYVEDICSEDSAAVLEEHLAACPACREKCRRMQSPEPVAQVPREQTDLAAFAKKVRRQRVRSVILFVGLLVLSVLLLDFADGLWYANYRMNDYAVEDGTWNLTAGVLETDAETVDQYVLYTDSTKITVTVTSDGDFRGTVHLYDTANPGATILTGQVTAEEDTVIFTNLSGARRYFISCEGLDGAQVTVSEGRSRLWNALGSLLHGFQ